MKHLPRGKDARPVTGEWSDNSLNCMDNFIILKICLNFAKSAMTVSQAHNIMAVCECEQDDARAKVKRTQLAHEGTTHL